MSAWCVDRYLTENHSLSMPWAAQVWRRWVCVLYATVWVFVFFIYRSDWYCGSHLQNTEQRIGCGWRLQYRLGLFQNGVFSFVTANVSLLWTHWVFNSVKVVVLKFKLSKQLYQHSACVLCAYNYECTVSDGSSLSEAMFVRWRYLNFQPPHWLLTLWFSSVGVSVCLCM